MPLKNLIIPQSTFQMHSFKSQLKTNTNLILLFTVKLKKKIFFHSSCPGIQKFLIFLKLLMDKMFTSTELLKHVISYANNIMIPTNNSFLHYIEINDKVLQCFKSAHVKNSKSVHRKTRSRVFTNNLETRQTAHSISKNTTSLQKHANTKDTKKK